MQSGGALLCHCMQFAQAYLFSACLSHSSCVKLLIINYGSFVFIWIFIKLFSNLLFRFFHSYSFPFLKIISGIYITWNLLLMVDNLLRLLVFLHCLTSFSALNWRLFYYSFTASIWGRVFWDFLFVLFFLWLKPAVIHPEKSERGFSSSVLGLETDCFHTPNVFFASCRSGETWF